MTCALSLEFFNYGKFQECIKEKENRITNLCLPIHSFNNDWCMAMLVLSTLPSAIFSLHYKASSRHHMILSINISLNNKDSFLNITLYHNSLISSSSCPFSMVLICLNCFLRTVVIIFSLNIVS